MSDTRHVSTTGAWRLVRGVAVGGSATGLGALAHSLGGGSAPPLAALAPMAMLVGATCVLLSRVRWTFPRLLVVLVLAQSLLHLAFGWYDAIAGPDMMAMSGHHEMPAHHAAAAAPPGMFAMHVVMGIVTSALLRPGEQSLRTLLDALALRVVRVLTGTVTVPAPIRPSLALAPLARPLSRTPDQTWRTRGPPAR
ncbi:MAG: hypothetical protein GEU96_09345 [Propionibacteriales bacterium]|nr:hypothetical protein [Propionibacteriales bacterium]